jgi:1-acyl-sn-glycerol-3-phosphate acyltransferase
VAEGRESTAASRRPGAARLRADAEALRDELDALRADLAAGPDGLDPGVSALAADVFEPVYDRWLRVEARGLEHVPEEGPALLVGGAGGLLPAEGAVLKLAVLRRSAAGRPLRVVVPDWLLALPLVGPLLLATGEAPAEAARALLARGELVAVPGLPQTGAAAAALELGAPLIPVHVQAPTLPGIGALLVPGRWRVELLEPVVTAGAGDPTDPEVAHRLAIDVRERLDAAATDGPEAPAG